MLCVLQHNLGRSDIFSIEFIQEHVDVVVDLCRL